MDFLRRYTLFLVFIELLVRSNEQSDDECNSPKPFGMESGLIPDSNITSSSEEPGWPASAGRLYKVQGAWCAGIQNSGQWLQIDIGENRELLAIATEGTQHAWVTGYYLLYSFDLNEWYCFGYDGIPQELASSQYSRYHVLYNRPVVRYIRLNPTGWRNKICLRVEIYGCSLDANINRIEPSAMPKTCAYTPTEPPTISTTDNSLFNITNTSTSNEPIPTTEQTTTTTAPITLKPIDSVRIRLSQTTIQTGKNLFMGVFYHNGDAVNYIWDLGNGETRHRDDSKVFSYAYEHPGIYFIKVLGYNDVSNATDSISVTVVDSIKVLKFLSDIEPVVPNTTFRIHWNIEQGTNVSYTVTFGDNSPVKTLHATEVGIGPYTLYHRYSSVGHYDINIHAVNLVSYAGPLRKTVIVEKEIRGLSVRWVFPKRYDYGPKKIYLATGEEIKVVSKVTSGTDPLYLYDFGERKIGNISEANISFQYSSAGLFTTSLKCFNHVSTVSQTYDVPILVQKDEPITGLQILLFPTSLGNTTDIKLSINTGTGYVCYWLLGDGFETLTDFGSANTSISHLYKSIGHFTVKVCCENKYGNSCTQATAHVDIPIQIPKMATSLEVIQTNGSKAFNITLHNGSDVMYDVDFGDGNIFEAHFPNTSARDRVFQISHIYSSVGIYFASLTAKNRLGKSRVEAVGPIVVQNPIGKNIPSLMVTSPVKIPNGKVAFSINYTTELHTPTKVSCLWDLGDSSRINTSIPASLEHSYIKQGRYRVVLSCANAVSHANISTIVVVYRMLTPRITISPPGKIVQHSWVPDGIYFATGTNVTFCVTTQSYDIMYVWSGFGITTHASNKSCIHHLLSGPGAHRIEVLVNNLLEKITVRKSFHVQDKISGLRITSNGTYIIKSDVLFMWSADNFGTNACYYLNLNDSANDVIFGRPSCDPHSARELAFSKNGNITYKYTYIKEGLYYVSIKGRNIVSMETAIAEVNVRKPLCDVFNATIIWNNKNNDTLTFMRSEAFELQARFEQQCYFAEGFEIIWKFLKVSGGVETTVQLSPIQMARKEFLSFRALDLSYGIYKAEVFIRLTGKDLHNLYGQVSTTKTLNIVIVPSPLRAFIKSGPYREIDPDYSFTLDGGSSMDPDEYIPTLNIGYRWYCRMFRQVLDRYFGCYADYKRPSDIIGYSRMLIVQPKEFIRNTTYFFTLEIYKRDRTATYQQAVFVTFGLPPSMKIMCLPSCSGLLIPSLSLVLLANCLSCGDSDGALVNRWDVYQHVNKTLKPFQILASQTRYGLVTARLEVLPNIFTPGEKYLVILSAWKLGGLPGSTNYSFVAYKNTPPRPGNCSIVPSSGYAMDTTFTITCIGWLDRDQPLIYTFSYQMDEDVTLLCSGEKNKWDFKLPIKEGAENATLSITADVQDLLGMSSVVMNSVLVRKPKSIDLSSIMDTMNKDTNTGEASNTSTPAKKKSVAEVVQLTSIVTYSLNQAKKTTDKTSNKDNNITDGEDGGAKSAEENKKAQEIRETLTNQLSDVIKGLTSSNTTKVNDLDLVTNAMRDVSREPQELTISSMIAVSDSLSDIVSSLKSMMHSNTGSMTPEEKSKMAARVKTIATKIIETISNVMMAVESLSASCTISGEFNETKMEKVQLTVKKLMETLNEASKILLYYMKVGDPPYYQQTLFSNITLERNSGQTVSNKTFTCRSGWFGLPRTHALLKDYNSSIPTIVDAQMMEFPNPYEFCKSRRNVTSKLISLVLRQSNGTKYNISNTKEDIQISISQISRPKQRNEMDSFNFSRDVSTTRFHLFNWTSMDSAVTIEFLPNSSYLEKSVKWNVYVTYGQQRLSTGHASAWTVYSSNISSKIHMFQLGRDKHRYSGEHKIYVTVDLPSIEGELPLNISYSLGIYQSTCLYWDDTENRFDAKGCRVGLKTNRKTTHCVCDHLTSFGSRLDIIPHYLGYDEKVIIILETPASPVVLSAVIVAFCIYLLILVWARNKDTEEIGKGEIVHLSDNHPSYKFKYEVTIFTGRKSQASTTANVGFMVRGEDGETLPRALKDYHQQRFQTSGVDAFLLCTPFHLGKLSFVELWHDNTGENPSWYVDKITIRDVFKDQAYYFMCNRWLAVEYDDGQVKRTLPVAKKKEIEAFGHLFSSVSRKNLTDRHTWLSVFKKPARSRFTRVQRASCCLALAYCVMLCNLVFYLTGSESNPSDTIPAGPLRLSSHQIWIGIVSYLIILPINLIIVGIFRSLKEKNQDQEDKKNKAFTAPMIIEQRDLVSLLNWYKITGQSENMCKDSYSKTGRGDAFREKVLIATGKQSHDLKIQKTIEELGIFLPSINLGINDQLGQALQRKQRKDIIRLPYHFLYLGWFYFIALSSVSAYFVVAYGEQFREEKASQWLTSVIVSLVFDIVIFHPLKVLVIAFYFTSVLKEPDEDDYGTKHHARNGRSTRHDEYHNTTHPAVPLAPSNEDLEKARTKRLREIQMNVILKDIVVYVFFLASLLMVSYSHRDPQAFAVAQSLMDTFIGGTYAGNSLNEVDGTTNYWNWIEGTVIPSLSSANRTWAPECNPAVDYAIDCNTRVIGTGRLRQLRIPPDTCQVPKDMQNVTKTCNDFYSLLSEDKANYTEGWKQSNLTTDSSTHSPWHYQSMFEIGGYPYIGLMSTYSGGGYIYELRNTGDGLEALKKNSWINQHTRALFVEISVYNAQVDMFGIATFLTEWMPTNGVLYFNNVKAARLYIKADTKQAITTACQIFMVLFLVFFIYGESKKVYKERKQYFKDAWNWFEINIIIFILGCLGALNQRSKLTTKAITEMQNPTKFVNLIQAATFDELLTYFLGLVVFVANLKLLKLFRFNHRVYLFTRTLSNAKSPLMSFMMVFSIFYIAYCSIYYLIFGGTMHDYRSMISTIESVFNILLGGFDFNSMEEADRIFGPILFFSFMLIMVMILMNMFLTILMDAFAEVQGDENLKANELEVLDHAMARLDHFIKARKRNKVGDLSEAENLSEDDSNKCRPLEIKQSMEGETDASDNDANTEEDQYKENINEEQDSDNEDALDKAIKRAQLKVRMKQMALLSRIFPSKSHGVLGMAVPPKRTLDEKLVGLTACFQCAALDDITLDRAYEELFRQYVKTTKSLSYEREMKRQAEFASSWENPQTTFKQKQNKVYSRYMH